MRVKASRPVWVKPQNEDKKRLLNKNETVDVDGRKYKDHAFIKAGYLVEQSDRSAPAEKPKRGPKPKSESAKVESDSAEQTGSADQEGEE